MRAATKFIKQEEQVKIFSKIKGQVNAKFCKRPFNKWSTFTISAIKKQRESISSEAKSLSRSNSLLEEEKQDLIKRVGTLDSS